MKIEFNQKKFQELVLHIARLSQGDKRFGATKLNKLLFYMDFGSYRLFGTPITGATYQHLPAGPAPRQLLEVRNYLVDCGDAVIEDRPYFNGNQKRIVANREPDLSSFTEQELAVVEDVIDEFWTFDARTISDYSHQEWSWRVTEDYEDISYHYALVSSEPMTPEQIETGRTVAAEYGLVAP